MKSPKDDLAKRIIVWHAMHHLWLDTDVDELYLVNAVKNCADTDYTLPELEQIFWREVYPFMRFNLIPWTVAGAWTPLDIEDVSTAILKAHKFGKRLWFKKQRRYAFDYWQDLSSAIKHARNIA